MLGESSSDFVIKNFQNLHNGRQQELTYDTIVHMVRPLFYIFKNTVVYYQHCYSDYCYYNIIIIFIIGIIKLWNLMISQ